MKPTERNRLRESDGRKGDDRKGDDRKGDRWEVVNKAADCGLVHTTTCCVLFCKMFRR